MLTKYRNLPATVWVLFFSRLINNMGNFIAPFMTLLLTTRYGFSIQTAGWVVMTVSAVGLVGSMFGGKIADQFGRRKAFLLFSTLTAASMFVAGFAGKAEWVAFFLILRSFFGGISGPFINTIVTDVTKEDERTEAFSLMYIALNIGYAVGPLLAGLLFASYTKVLFFGDGATTLLSVLLVARFVPETKPTVEEVEESAEVLGEDLSLWQLMVQKPSFLWFCFWIMGLFFVFSQFNFGLPLQVESIFGLEGAKLYGGLMTINAVMCSVLTVFINSYLSRFSAATNIAMASLFYMVGFGMLGVVTSIAGFVLSTVLWTIGEIIIATNTNVYIANHAPVTHRGRFNAIFPVIRRVGFILGPPFAGWMSGLRGLEHVWLVNGFVALIIAMGMFRLKKDSSSTSS